MATPAIIHEVFNGIIPRIDPRLLKENNAQIARNCDLRSGKIGLYTVPGAPAPVEREIYSTDDVVARPAAPTLAGAEYAFDPSLVTCNWYGGPDFGEIACTYTGCTQTDKGVVLRYWFPGATQNILGGWDVPTYRLTFNNGKEEVNTPPSVGSELISGDRMLLYINEADPEYVYGELSVVGQKANDFRLIYFGSSSTITYYTEHEVLITCDMRYMNPIGQYCSYSLVKVNANGALSQASTPTEPVLRKPGMYIRLTFSGLSTGEKYRVYRSSKAQGGTFRLLTEIGDGAMIFDDIYPDSSLTLEMPGYVEFEDDASPVDKSIPDTTDVWTKVVNCGSFMASFDGQELYFSEPDHPYIWPDDYTLTFTETIIGLADVGSHIVVMTDGDPYVINFSGHPKYATAFRIVMNGQFGCMNANTIFRQNSMVGYVSLYGIVVIRGQEAEIASLAYYREEQWNALMLDINNNPKAITARIDLNKLIIDLLGGTDRYLIFDISGGKFGDHTTGDGTTAVVWKSKEYTYGRPVEFNHVRAVADSYSDLAVKVFADGTEVCDRDISSETAFKIEKERPAKRWSMQLEITGVDGEYVHELSMATNIDSLKV